MKLTNLEVKPVLASTGTGQNESREARQSRMQAYWKEPTNSVLHPVGRLLALTHNGKTLAELVAAGESIEMESITIGNKSFPLQPGFALSLTSLTASWGCPACRSAHGSGVYPSREVSAKLLSGNKFFYRPADKALFVISDTCWGDYVKGMGAATAARFSQPDVAPAKQKPAAVKA